MKEREWWVEVLRELDPIVSYTDNWGSYGISKAQREQAAKRLRIRNFQKTDFTKKRGKRAARKAES